AADEPADGDAQRGLVPDAVAGVDIGPLVEEQLDNLRLALAGGDPQGGDADLVPRVDVGPLSRAALTAFGSPARTAAQRASRRSSRPAARPRPRARATSAIGVRRVMAVLRGLLR